MNKRQTLKKCKNQGDKSLGGIWAQLYPTYVKAWRAKWNRDRCCRHLCGACIHLDTREIHPWGTNCLAKQDPSKETCPFFRSKYSKKK